MRASVLRQPGGEDGVVAINLSCTSLSDKRFRQGFHLGAPWLLAELGSVRLMPR